MKLFLTLLIPVTAISTQAYAFPFHLGESAFQRSIEAQSELRTVFSKRPEARDANGVLKMDFDIAGRTGSGTNCQVTVEGMKAPANPDDSSLMIEIKTEATSQAGGLALTFLLDSTSDAKIVKNPGGFMIKQNEKHGGALSSEDVQFGSNVYSVPTLGSSSTKKELKVILQNDGSGLLQLNSDSDAADCSFSN